MDLFVTDLDGTLLNSDIMVSGKSTEIINKLIKEGMQFTVATARTPATAVDLLENLNITLPVVLMNGVLVYDLKKKEYIDIKEINKSIMEKVLIEVENSNKSPLIYGIKDDHLWVYHKEFSGPVEEKFYKDRVDKPLKTFVKVEDYREAIRNSDIINIVSFDTYEKISQLGEALNKIEGLTVNTYEDVYDRGTYFLEAYSTEASKANGIKFLANYVSHEKLVCFGDNLNDIPMFELADESYATANAADKLKELATDVIGSCNEDGVAEFLDKYSK